MRRLGFLFTRAFPVRLPAIVRPTPSPPTPKAADPWPFVGPGGRYELPTIHPPIPGRDKPPGATLPEPPVDTRPPVADPNPPGGGVKPPPVVEVPPPVVEVPPAPAGVDLIGHELVCRMVHFDGLDRIGADVRGLMVAMEDRAIMLRDAQIPELWAMTAPQVAMFEAEERGFLASLVGPTIAAREPHKGSGTALEAREALAAAGVAPCAVLGSCLVPAQYVDGPWSVLVTGAEVGHVRDTEYSGFVVVVPGKVSVQSAATASAAQKSRIAREVGTGALPWGFEVMSISALAPQTGQAHVGEGGVTHYFGTPATKDRADHPDTLSAPAEVAWSRMLDGAHEHASRIVCVGFLEAVEAASRAGVLASGEALYKVVKS